MKTIYLFFMLSLISWVANCQEIKSIEISQPKNKDLVGYRVIVEGKLPVPCNSVWVVVHPLNLSDYWVQPKPSIHEDSTYKTSIYIGSKGHENDGETFEIRVFGEPKNPLQEGKVLNDWPKAKYGSKLIEVTRK
jgi:hypothetical protein